MTSSKAHLRKTTSSLLRLMLISFVISSKLNELKKRSILCGRGNNDARSAVWLEMSSASVDQQVVLADGETLGYVTHDVSDYSLQDGQL